MAKGCNTVLNAENKCCQWIMAKSMDGKIVQWTVQVNTLVLISVDKIQSPAQCQLPLNE